jgi:hypothetical protein
LVSWPPGLAARIRALPLPAGDTLSTGGEDAREQALEEAATVALRVGNFGDYRRDELTADFGQPRFDLMNSIVDAIRSLKAAAPAIPLSTGGWNSDMEKAPRGLSHPYSKNPDHSTFVLVATAMHVGMGYLSEMEDYDEDTGHFMRPVWLDEHDEEIPEPVIAWMPLPEPPPGE